MAPPCAGGSFSSSSPGWSSASHSGSIVCASCHASASAMPPSRPARACSSAGARSRAARAISIRWRSASSPSTKAPTACMRTCRCSPVLTLVTSRASAARSATDAGHENMTMRCRRCHHRDSEFFGSCRSRRTGRARTGRSTGDWLFFENGLRPGHNSGNIRIFTVARSGAILLILRAGRATCSLFLLLLFLRLLAVALIDRRPSGHRHVNLASVRVLADQ